MKVSFGQGENPKVSSISKIAIKHKQLLVLTEKKTFQEVHKFDAVKNQLAVIYEDNHLLAVNKPAGWLVHGDRTGDLTLQKVASKYVAVKYKKPGRVFLGVIHRIDRPVSGLVIFARTSKALERMNRLFQKNEIEKTYFALVGKQPPEHSMTLVDYLVKDTKRNRVHVYQTAKKGAKRSELSFELAGKVGKNYLLKVNLKTGRPHQIRAQLGKLGCPILQDVKYGFHPGDYGGEIYLHHYSSSFIHPVSKEQKVLKADLPKDKEWNRFSELVNE